MLVSIPISVEQMLKSLHNEYLHNVETFFFGELWCHTGTGITHMLLKVVNEELIAMLKVKATYILGGVKRVYTTPCFLIYRLHLLYNNQNVE